MEGGIFLLLGSNLGDRRHNLSEAKDRIGGILQSSDIYSTAAWGRTTQPDFFNQAIEIQSQLNPKELLLKLLEIEVSMGRIRTEKWGPRTIDIDILFYRNEIINNEDLVIPHPQLQFRRFALQPLSEITNIVHPVLKKTISELLEECTDTLAVTRLRSQR